MNAPDRLVKALFVVARSRKKMGCGGSIVEVLPACTLQKVKTVNYARTPPQPQSPFEEKHIKKPHNPQIIPNKPTKP